MILKAIHRDSIRLSADTPKPGGTSERTTYPQLIQRARFWTSKDFKPLLNFQASHQMKWEPDCSF